MDDREQVIQCSNAQHAHRRRRRRAEADIGLAPELDLLVGADPARLDTLQPQAFEHYSTGERARHHLVMFEALADQWANRPASP